MKENLGEDLVKGNSLKRSLTNIISLIGLGILIVLLVFLQLSNNKKVSVVQATEDIYPNKIIKNVEKYRMDAKEYNNSSNKYLLWSEIDKCKNKYSTVFVKKGEKIVVGDYRDNRPIKNAWLREVTDGNVVITLPYNKSEAFGNILTPGDHVAVMISYESSTESQSNMFANVSTKRIPESLFKKIKIIDLLNSSGNSIYDYYTDLLNMPVSDRDTLLRDESFLNNVSPSSMMLEVTPADFLKYAEVRGLPGLTFTYGLHKRSEGDIVVDQFQDLTRQISNAQTQLESGGK